MKHEYRISESDYTEATLMDAGYKSRVIARLGCHFVIIALMIAAWMLLDLPKFIVVGGAAYIGAVVSCLLVGHVLCAYLAKRHYRNYKLMQGPLSLEPNDEGIVFGAECGEAQLTWDHCLKWREGENLILVYIAPRLFHIIPKLQLSDGFDLDDLRAKLAAAIGPAS